MPKTETLNLRISAEFKKRLIEEAAKEKRSVTNYIESTLTALWEARSIDAREKTKKR
jgi:predicted HicB family RNase H-like nuclease